jgi:hypothetical protein
MRRLIPPYAAIETVRGSLRYARLRRSAPTDNGRENRMAFMFKLELEDGTPADPPTFSAAVPNWRSGDVIPLGRGKALRVIGTRPGQKPDDDLVLVVETAGP